MLYAWKTPILNPNRYNSAKSEPILLRKGILFVVRCLDK